MIVSLIFTSFHMQYQHLSTLIEMMASSVIFAWNRIRSDGLALPVLLHTFVSTPGSTVALLRLSVFQTPFILLVW
ncbi:CPBP family glutamic-type intramembrane protease [Dryocola clanedunensis]|uniref:CPBP family glutamic-type intramembrane protease n=1 Tax=Dryocola clanedunensis TaxID=2925396 RepID=UPI0038CBF89C